MLRAQLEKLRQLGMIPDDDYMNGKSPGKKRPLYDDDDDDDDNNDRSNNMMAAHGRSSWLAVHQRKSNRHQ